MLLADLTGTSTEQPYESINTKLVYDVEVPTDTPRPSTSTSAPTIGTDYAKYYSEPVAVTVTATKAERVYPTVWVIGDYCGWNHGNSQFLFSFLDDESTTRVSSTSATKAANGFKDHRYRRLGRLCTTGYRQRRRTRGRAASITLISSGGSGATSRPIRSASTASPSTAAR